MVSFPEAIQLFFKNYTNFQGRSRRSEYWWVILALVIVLYIPLGIAYASIMSTGDMSGIALIMSIWSGVVGLAILLPMISLAVRRFHDLGQTGWLVLAFWVAGLLPIVGLISGIGQIVWFCFPGTNGPNKYGPDPRQGNIVPDTFS